MTCKTPPVQIVSEKNNMKVMNGMIIFLLYYQRDA